MISLISLVVTLLSATSTLSAPLENLASIEESSSKTGNDGSLHIDHNQYYLRKRVFRRSTENDSNDSDDNKTQDSHSSDSDDDNHAPKSAADYYVKHLPGTENIPKNLLPTMHAGHITVNPEHEGKLFLEL